MSQYYIGIKRVFASPAKNKDGQDGYAVTYRYGQPDAYQSWSPKEEFEKFYLPMGERSDGSRISQQMVDEFIVEATPSTVDGKMTVTNIELRNGTLYAESSACVDPKNYSESIGHSICVDRAKDRVWHLLGFVLQWAKDGLKS